MRQLWISVGILVVMVALLFWNVAKVDQLAQPMLKELSQATTAAQRDDWSKAEVLTQQIQVHWEKGMHHLRFVQMHDAIDEVTRYLSAGAYAQATAPSTMTTASRIARYFVIVFPPVFFIIKGRPHD